MHQNHIRSKSAELFPELLTGIRTARRSLLATAALGIAVTACLPPKTAHAQEYPLVRVAGKLPRLRLYDTSAVSVDGIENRWLCPHSAVTFSQRAALSDAKSASRLKARLRPANYMCC